MEPNEEVLTDEEDDDCVMLEGDPDISPTFIHNLSEAYAVDLIVVSEKGEVACRDFPHPRHLCAAFPFALTSHVEHCDQCYCYACDSVAPCFGWGTGVSDFDHCHATDKELFWMIKRKFGKHGDKGFAPVPQSATNSIAQHLPTQSSRRSETVRQSAANSTSQQLQTQSSRIALATNPRNQSRAVSKSSGQETNHVKTPVNKVANTIQLEDDLEASYLRNQLMILAQLIAVDQKLWELRQASIAIPIQPKGPRTNDEVALIPPVVSQVNDSCPLPPNSGNK